MSINTKPLVIDAMNLLYRSFYGNEDLTSSKGEPTGAIYSFMRTVLGLQKKYKDYEPVFVFDKFPESALFGESTPDNKFAPPVLEDSTDRKAIYSEYKSNRKHMPDALVKQCWPMAFILHGLGYPVVIAPAGIEADDIVGTIITIAKNKGFKPKGASGDKDYLALIEDASDCTIYNFNDKKEYNEALLLDKWGIKPSQVSDFLALMGDSVDNIPGIEKCGEKTAAKWLNQYTNIQGIIDHADEIKGVVGEKLRNGLHNLPRNLLLTTIRTELPLSYEACTGKVEPNYDLVRNIFDNLDIKSFNSLIPDNNKAPAP